MIRFATIGSGPIVEAFLTEAQKHPDFTLTAVYSRTAGAPPNSPPSGAPPSPSPT